MRIRTTSPSSFPSLSLILSLALALIVCAAPGCDESMGMEPDSGGGGGIDSGGGGRDSGGTRPPMCVDALPLDLLFVIDNSNSMQEEQANLATNFPVLMEVLTNPPDDDGDGNADWQPLTDVRVGVVTTDLGTGSHRVISCETAGGDDGAMVRETRSPDPACTGVGTGGEPWMTYSAGDDTELFGEQFACLARLGTDGCGLEQQLESALLGLSERAGAGGPNEGFIREEALLAIVFVTDEDDCSASDDAIFDPSATAELGPLSTRCADHGELLHPVQRYIDGFQALKSDPDQPTTVVVAAIAGVPRPLVADPDAIDYEALLADEAMQYRHTGGMPDMIAPACDFGGVGSALPARRITQVIQPFAATGNGLVQSICNVDLSPAIAAIARTIGKHLCPPLM